MWKIANTAVTGRNHVRTGIPCQDKVIGRKYENDVFVITLADGAGSAGFSHFGAESVIDRVNTELGIRFEDYFAEDNTDALRDRLIQVIDEAISDACREHDCMPEDLSSTLLAAAVSGSRYIAVHIGDGVIGCLKDGKLVTESAPDNGEFINETVFTTSWNVYSHLRIMKGEENRLGGFVLMSDGTENAFYNRRSGQLSQGLIRIMRLLTRNSEQDFEEMLTNDMQNIVAGMTGDDCSLSLLVNSSFFQTVAGYPGEKLMHILHMNGESRDLKKRIWQARKVMQHAEYGTGVRRLAGEMYIQPSEAYRIVYRLKKGGLLEYDEGRYYSNL